MTTNRIEEIRADFESVNPESKTVSMMRNDIAYLLERVEKLEAVVDYYEHTLFEATLNLKGNADGGVE